ncbi:uncharacterized protein LOC103519841 [Diaphorina citri]|uniref:Uncharacterized protein LOC103519841 n=1 Tax=Diaphorina citri TaxID=121845 RepID=A0A3Q0JEY0_DIACI|nr:uncharacterized protein LOC103519841 [Diaphorina citri]
MINIPLTPGATIPAATYIQAYPNKASEFMFKQFAGFKDFTMNTAKSGLSFGEKFAFWMYNKMRSWSTQWFTHVFLMLVVVAYSLLGGFIFHVWEGEAELKALRHVEQERILMNRERNSVIKRMKEAFMSGDNNNYTIVLYDELVKYEDKVVKFAALPKNRRWTFWGSVFYSGTVYTTIALITVEIIPEPVEALPKITWRQFKLENAHAWKRLVVSRNRCVSLFIAFSIYLGLGALAIRFIEGAFENFYKCGVKRVKRDFIDTLWDRRYESEDEWKSMARRTLLNFENELQTAFEAGVKSYSGQQSWSFINSFMYCLNVVSTIGYGNISPSTNTGRAFTIMYAIFGIPIFLIVLADFGKLFTRAIKFVWAYVRRLYYTGSCRKVRRTGPVQEVMKGVKMVVDVAQQFRRPSQVISPEEQQNMNAFSKHLETPGNGSDERCQNGGGCGPICVEVMKGVKMVVDVAQQFRRPSQVISPEEQQNMNAFSKHLETPGNGGATPALSSYEIDEEFNLPISLALLILLCYIFCGSAVFVQWNALESSLFRNNN